MKTPREIILEKHRRVETRLESLNAETLASAARESLECAPAKSASPAHALSFVERFWIEAILPWKRVWIGFAAVWVGIVALNVAVNGNSGRVERQMTETDPQVKTVLLEQRQMLAQLLQPAGSQQASRSAIPGPRSEARREDAVV